MSARYRPGDFVRVSVRSVAGHCRTPRYIRGKTGCVERICGAFRDPEDLAYGRYDAELLTLYRVRFSQRDVWTDYAGGPSDTVDVEIYEHWLEPESGKR